jgi:hypothetical protein
MGSRFCRAMRVMTILVGISFTTAIASQADQLFSNGPVTSIPGGGPGNTGASRLQTSIGMTTLGFNADFAGSSVRALAEDFTVPAPGWHLTRLTFYAYQTSSGQASTLNDLRFVIMNGRPDLPGAAIVAGNPAVNSLSSTLFSQIYRDSEQWSSVDFRPIMTAVANVNISLPPGKYWIVWAIAGTMADGPWAPPLNIPGQPVTGNALQLCTCSGWGPATDTGTSAQQGFPFDIDGTLLTAPSLSVTPNSPTLSAGQRLTLTASLTGGSGSAVDAYVLLDVPGLGTFSITQGSLLPGTVPLARGIVPFAFSGVLLDITLPPVPLGTYTVRSLLTLPGTTTPVSSNQSTFAVVP